MQQGDGKGSAGAPLGLAQGNFGPKYEQHVGQIQKALEDSQKKVEELQREVDDLRCVSWLMQDAKRYHISCCCFLSNVVLCLKNQHEFDDNYTGTRRSSCRQSWMMLPMP